eukprot:GHVN01101103.1.p1 GENE.GHVN01101103.1~~GHVN01101103.1.p1  ORF type:complete len:119 (+),score=9.16 GHVN01101103.1:72-428(+)
MDDQAKEQSTGSTNESQQQKKNPDDDITIPLVGMVLSFILPFVGWGAFFACINAPLDSRKWLWAKRCNALASLLIVVYIFVISCLLGEFVTSWTTAPVVLGVGFGACPLADRIANGGC